MHNHYTTEKEEIKGRVLYYRPYPAEMMKRKPHPVSIMLRGILSALVGFVRLAVRIWHKDLIPYLPRQQLEQEG